MSTQQQLTTGQTYRFKSNKQNITVLQPFNQTDNTFTFENLPSTEIDVVAIDPTTTELKVKFDDTKTLTMCHYINCSLEETTIKLVVEDMRGTLGEFEPITP